MKFLYISNALISSRKANSMHIMKICSAFCSLNLDVSLICSSVDSLKSKNIHEYYGVSNNIRIHSFKNIKSSFDAYIYALKAFYLSIRIKPDMVLSRFLIGGFLSALFFNTLLELHQMPSQKSRLQKYLIKLIFFLPKFKGLIVITEPLKKIFIESGCPENLVYIFPDGADLKEFPKDVDRDLHINNTTNIGYAGHLYEGRGIEILIELATMSDSYMIHIAGGNDSDILRYKKLIKEKNIKNIHLHGFIEPSKVFNFFCNMDILLSPYQRKVHLEGGDITTEKWMSPLKIFEYMTAKKPIICSNIEVLHEVLEHKKNCLMCNPEDPKDWNNAIQLLLKDKNLANYLSENAYEDVKTKYSWDVRAKKIINLFTNMNNS